MIVCSDRPIDCSMVCDGFRDCLGGEDEHNCQSPEDCAEWWQVPCLNRQGGKICVGLTGLCDGRKDCENGADETPEMCR